jgi:DNA-binding transcriptional ArsR family regulator
MADADVFGAISAPPRRALLAMLAEREMGVTEIAGSFDMTMSAVSQHLAILRDAGLVRTRKEGRQRLYRLDPAPLRTVAEWVRVYEPFWTEKLADLGRYLEDNP